jgi:hypothetical protein
MQSDQLSLETARQRDWRRLYEGLEKTLSVHGRNDPFGEGDYFLIDDDYGAYQHKVECSNESFFWSGAALNTQALLCEYEGPWEVIFVLARKSCGPVACIVTRANITIRDFSGQEE